MPGDKGDGSMFETVKGHGERLDKNDILLDEHGNRISALERADADKTDTLEALTNQFSSMKSDFTNLENTIWKTAQSTQDMMTTQNAQQWKLIEALNNGKERERERKHDLSKTKLEKFWEWAGKITVALFGAGGFLILLIEVLAK